MRFLTSATALLLAAYLSAPAFSQTDPTSEPPPQKSDRAPSIEPGTPPESREERLDGLFKTLKSAKTPDEGKGAENAIAQLWLQSGSDTVDLMMSWTLKAMEEKNYS